MFTGSHSVLTLTQNGKSLDVILYLPQYVKGLNRDRDWNLAKLAVGDFIGRWKVGKNTINNKVDDGYTIGSIYPQERKCWTFNRERQTFLFREFSTWTGGSGFGNNVDECETALILNGAQDHGGPIEPAGDVGSGTVLIASMIFRPGIPISWITSDPG